MSNDYLWDRSGEPDPEIERLERVLGRLRDQPTAWQPPTQRVAFVPRARWSRLAVPLSLAAAILLLVAGVWSLPPALPASWTALPLEGVPRVATVRLLDETPVGIDQVVETNSTSTIRLTAADVGQVELGPGSRLRLLVSKPGEQRFALDHGTLHATIWAPPGEFAVETPSATALDLGCRYSLEVDRRGQGLLQVSIGWVGLERAGREALVPAGAACPIRSGRGPGIPYSRGSDERFVQALGALDDASPGVREALLTTVLDRATKADALSLWHLLSRLEVEEANRVFDRLASMIPPPAGVTRARILARDREALDAWWSELGLGSASLFRTFRAR